MKPIKNTSELYTKSNKPTSISKQRPTKHLMKRMSSISTDSSEDVDVNTNKKHSYNLRSTTRDSSLEWQKV